MLRVGILEPFFMFRKARKHEKRSMKSSERPGIGHGQDIYHPTTSPSGFRRKTDETAMKKLPAATSCSDNHENNLAWC